MRIQLDFPEPRVQELKTLMDEAGFETYKDLFNHSLTLLDWVINETKDGKSIAALDEQTDKYRVLAMPFLDRIAKAARKAEKASYTVSG